MVETGIVLGGPFIQRYWMECFGLSWQIEETNRVINQANEQSRSRTEQNSAAWVNTGISSLAWNMCRTLRRMCDRVIFGDYLATGFG